MIDAIMTLGAQIAPYLDKLDPSKLQQLAGMVDKTGKLSQVADTLAQGKGAIDTVQGLTKGLDLSSMNPDKIKEIQEQLGVTVDGIVGPETKGAYEEWSSSQKGGGLAEFAKAGGEEGIKQLAATIEQEKDKELDAEKVAQMGLGVTSAGLSVASVAAPPPWNFAAMAANLGVKGAKWGLGKLEEKKDLKQAEADAQVTMAQNKKEQLLAKRLMDMRQGTSRFAGNR
jgi:hypothetical protein